MSATLPTHHSGTTQPGGRVGSSEALLAVCALALCAARVLSPAHIEHGPILCPFRAVTGLPCPGCGLTRCWVYLTHGQLEHAVRANAFGIPLAILAVGAILWRLTTPLLRRAGLVSGPPDIPGMMASRRAILFLWLPWLAFAVVRATLIAAT
jgi:hypothetical protein